MPGAVCPHHSKQEAKVARENGGDDEESQRPAPICGIGCELLEHAPSPFASHARERPIAAGLTVAGPDQLAHQPQERPPQPRREVKRAEGGERDHGDAVGRTGLL